MKADVSAQVAGLNLGSPDLDRALGSTIDLKSGVDWVAGGNVKLTGARIVANGARFEGDATF